MTKLDRIYERVMKESFGNQIKYKGFDISIYVKHGGKSWFTISKDNVDLYDSSGMEYNDEDGEKSLRAAKKYIDRNSRELDKKLDDKSNDTKNKVDFSELKRVLSQRKDKIPDNSINKLDKSVVNGAYEMDVMYYQTILKYNTKRQRVDAERKFKNAGFEANGYTQNGKEIIYLRTDER